MKLAGLIILMIAGGLIAASVQHRQIQSLRQQNQALKETQARTDLIKKQIAQATPHQVDAAELARLRHARSDLIPLRAKIAQLRQLNGPQDPEAALAEIQKETEEEIKKFEFLQQNRIAEKTSKEIRSALQHFLSIVRSVGRKMNSNIESFEQLAAAVNSLPPTDPLRRQFERESSARIPNTISWHSFEFIPGGGHPRLLLREIQPRIQPGGKWKRAYALRDGKITEIGLDTPLFEQWEQEQR